MQTDLVSTIIPVYNRAQLMHEAVRSVLAQTYRPIEVIIVDDGSTDETPAAADELARTNPSEIRVIHQKNAGPGMARELGRSHARGEFIQYLDSDDLLLPRKFELQVEGLKAHPEFGASYGKTRYGHIGMTSDVAWKRTGEHIPTMFPSMLGSRWWGTSTPLYRRAVTDAAGPWSKLTNEEDWEYDCRIATQGIRLHYVPEFISEEREHDGDRLSQGSTSDKFKLSQRAEAHALILKHAQAANIPDTSAEMKSFARELFLLSRQCGAAGLAEESRRLFELAKRASGRARAEKLDFKLYALMATVTGWRLTGKLACYSDTLRK